MKKLIVAISAMAVLLFVSSSAIQPALAATATGEGDLTRP
jgi:hypothetical protein